MIYENKNGIITPIKKIVEFGGGVNYSIISQYENLNGNINNVFNNNRIDIVKNGKVSSNIICYSNVWNDKFQSITYPECCVLESGDTYATMKTTNNVSGRFKSNFTGNSALSICILFNKGKDNETYKMYCELFGCSVKFQYSGSAAKEYFGAIAPAMREGYYIATNNTSATVSEAIQSKSYVRDITLDSVLVNGKSYHRIDMMYLSCWKNSSSVYPLNIYSGSYVNIKNLYLVKE